MYKNNRRPHYFFVYGFLMSQYRQLPQLEVPPMPVVYIGRGYLYGSLFQVEDFPGYVPDFTRRNRVYGEIYLLKEQTNFFKQMDEYELADIRPDRENYYRRLIRPAHIGVRTYRCWVYEYIRSTVSLRQIRSGRFKIN